MISKDKIISWLKLMRLEFYSMPLVVYVLGALISYRLNNLFFIKNFFIGYSIIFLIELITVLTNEYYDYNADKLNPRPTRFTGGSRVLVQKKISLRAVKYSIIFVFFIIVLTGVCLLKVTSFSIAVLFLLVLGIILGISYTTPPLKLSYRGLGEIDVAFIHGFYVIICGYVFQSKILDTSIIFIVAIPIFFSSLAGVSLAGISDIDSDRLVSKKSLALILGRRCILIFSAFFTIVTGIISTYLWPSLIFGTYSYIYFLITLYSIILVFIIFRAIQKSDIMIEKLILRAMFLIALSTFVPLIIFIFYK